MMISTDFKIDHHKSNLKNLWVRPDDYSSLVKIVQTSRVIVQSYFHNYRTSVFHLCASEGMTLQDLAYDCVLEAFRRNADNRLFKIDNFINSFTANFDSVPALDVFRAYRGLMIKIANAQLVKIYHQADPVGSKIHRNIREAVKKSKKFSLLHDARGFTLTPLGIDPLNGNCSFPFDELEEEFISYIKPGSSIKELLSILYEILLGQNTYRRTLLLFDTAQLFKKAYSGQEKYFIEEFDQPGGDVPFAALDQLEIDEICEQVERAVKEKIFLYYLARGKINLAQAEGLHSAVSDLIYDWARSANSDDSFFNYLRRYIDIDPEKYKSDYRAKMEYLVKIARAEFKIRLIPDL